MKRWLAIGWLVLLGLAVLAAYGWWVYLDTWAAVGTLVAVMLVFANAVFAVWAHERDVLSHDSAGTMLAVGIIGSMATGAAVAYSFASRAAAFAGLAIVAAITATLWSVATIVDEYERRLDAGRANEGEGEAKG